MLSSNKDEILFSTKLQIITFFGINTILIGVTIIKSVKTALALLASESSIPIEITDIANQFGIIIDAKLVSFIF